MTSGLDEHSKAFQEVVDGVARALADVRHVQDASFISLPVMYPSGSLAVVRIDLHHDGHFLVSDMGMGFEEADLMGAGRLFAHSAPAVAVRAGVHFDRQTFSLGVRREQLVGAVSVIAACSQEAVQVAAFRLDEKKKADAADRLCERLYRLFTPAKVERGATVVGASNTPWTVTALVRADGHKAVYEPVSDHPNSVASALTKFVDLNQLEHPPARIAVVRNKDALGTRLALIATAANVVEEGVSDQTLQRLALEDAA
ncbi:MAG: hypothetical protein HQL38_05025 [Alphaproteobacteria bacterium]|nr:hypothetical protein [Alphaproteobacteria bacterium]MBF0392025.1 hypothetical protein [Alphaproteobacteria bacterium]